MKGLLLIGLTTILGVSSLATAATAHPDWSRGQESYHQEDTPKLSPIPEPLRYRVERRPETVEPEIHKEDHQWQRADLPPGTLRDRYVPENDYYRERRRYLRFRRYHHGTRNDPGRY